jgi:tetratricopeptide (TPR) repeat protein
MTRPELPEPDDAAWERAAEEHERAVALLESGSVEEAEALAERAHAALVVAVGAEHPDAANALDTIASARAARGSLAQAIEGFRAAVAIFERWRGEEAVDPMRFGAAGRLARALTDAGDFAGARALLTALCAEAEAAYGDESLAVAECCNGLGINDKLAGHLDEAGRWYARAEGCYRAQELPLPPALLHNLAGLACARGEHVEAERHVRAALALRREEGDDGSRALGTDLAGLGDALAGQGRFGEAEAAYREALSHYRAHGHASDPEVAYALHNLGDTLAELGRGDDAERAYLEAIERKRVTFGEAHHELAASHANLATLYRDLGRTAAARAHGERAAAIARGALDADHPVRVGCEEVLRRLT